MNFKKPNTFPYCFKQTQLDLTAHELINVS